MLSAGLALAVGVILVVAGARASASCRSSWRRRSSPGSSSAWPSITVGQIPACSASRRSAGRSSTTGRDGRRGRRDHVPAILGVGTLDRAARPQAPRSAHARGARRPGRGHRRLDGARPARAGRRRRRGCRDRESVAAPPGDPVGDIIFLITGAFGIVFLALAESIGAARSFGARHGYDVDPDQELIALGASNVASGLFGGFAVDASLSQSATGEAAGNRTQLATLARPGSSSPPPSSSPRCSATCRCRCWRRSSSRRSSIS